MLESLRELVGDKLDKHDLWIEEAFYEKEGSINYFRIVLDSNKVLDLSTVTIASRIINKVIDDNDFVKEECMLDIYAKPKGDGKDEQ